jgi:hypothetical protein
MWQSGVVAALFALHPLHVELVAWVAKRKDVLSTFFWLLTLQCYINYTEHPGIRRYLPVLLFFILGLMAKPMLVTLPCVLLAVISWLAILNWKKRPCLLVGWLWYLGTLVPVIGLVQVGMQSMADRYKPMCC